MSGKKHLTPFEKCFVKSSDMFRTPPKSSKDSEESPDIENLGSEQPKELGSVEPDISEPPKPEEKQSVQVTEPHLSSETTTTTSITTTITPSSSSAAAYSAQLQEEEAAIDRADAFKWRCSKSLPSLRANYNQCCRNVAELITNKSKQEAVYHMLELAYSKYQELRRARTWCESVLTEEEKQQPSKKSYWTKLVTQMSELETLYETAFPSAVEEDDYDWDEDTSRAMAEAVAKIKGKGRVSFAESTRLEKSTSEEPSIPMPGSSKSSATAYRPSAYSWDAKDFMESEQNSIDEEEEDRRRYMKTVHQQEDQRRRDYEASFLQQQQQSGSNFNAGSRNDSGNVSGASANQSINSDDPTIQALLNRLSQVEANQSNYNNNTTATADRSTVRDELEGLGTHIAQTTFRINDEIGSKFNGDYTQYFTWRQQFDQARLLMNKLHFSKIKQFRELIKSVEGPPLEMLKGMEIAPTNESLDQALDVLDDLYGDKLRLIQGLAISLLNMEPMKDSIKSLQKGYSLAHSLWKSFIGYDLTAEDLAKILFTSIVESKLSQQSLREFHKILHARRDSESAVGSTFEATDILNAIKRTLDLMVAQEGQSRLRGEKPKHDSNRNPQNSNSQNSRPKTFSVHATKGMSNEELRKCPCIICEGKKQHDKSLKCPDLPKMSAEDLMARLQGYRACYKCLAPGAKHKSKDCHLQRCNKENCNGHHARIIHDRLMELRKKAPRAQNTGNKSDTGAQAGAAGQGTTSVPQTVPPSNSNLPPPPYTAPPPPPQSRPQ